MTLCMCQRRAEAYPESAAGRRPSLVPASHKERLAAQRKVAVAGDLYKVLLSAGIGLQKVQVRPCCALHVGMNTFSGLVLHA